MSSTPSDRIVQYGSSSDTHPPLGFASSTARTEEEVSMFFGRNLTKVVEILIQRVEALQNDLDKIRGEKTDKNQISNMKARAESLISKRRIPIGKFIALTFEGDLVAEADSKIEILRKIHSIDQDDIFIWKVGSEFVESW